MMSQTRMTVTLNAEVYRRLCKAAQAERLRPATLAAHMIDTVLRQRIDMPEAQSPFLALVDWVASRVDEIRAAGGWPEDVTIAIFERIEREAVHLYAAAQAELGQANLNRNIGRLIRKRLGADVRTRGGRAVVIPVRADRTSLIKTASLLVPIKGATS